VKVKRKGKGNDWPKAPQFIDPSTSFATSKQVDILSNRINQMIGKINFEMLNLVEINFNLF
jgi:hypothetical protein